ncbi:unnamed protein product [Clonostachys solani]|uniref:Uncharacterized protein n=1 Tax=Clonostachys solani TaxID=160281 RepID=A0A9N9Z3Q7_9HYPO|nr:unnamed protein product [Clonostachys solani]
MSPSHLFALNRPVSTKTITIRKPRTASTQKGTWRENGVSQKRTKGPIRKNKGSKTQQGKISAMCNWNTYTFDCGCMQVDLRSRCQRKLADDELDPCFWMQRVSEKWRFHQQRMCDTCNYRLLNGEYVPMRKQARWSEIGARAHEIARLMARARQLG